MRTARQENTLVKRGVGRPRREKAEGQSNPRLDMLHAAAELFARNGVAQTNVAMVAKRSGYTPAAVHYHFKNCDTLLEQVMQFKLGPLMEYVWAGLDVGLDDPLDIALEITRRIFSIGVQNPWLPPLWLGEIVAGGGSLKKHLLRRIPRAKVRAFNSLLARGQQEGTINPHLEPRLVILNLLGVSMFTLAAREFWGLLQGDGSPLTERTVLKHAEAMLRGGLSAGRGEG